MKQLDLLVCPKCKNKLKNEGGSLNCDIDGKYQVKNNIPVFVKTDTSFDMHWNNSSLELPASKINVAKDFLKPVFENKSNNLIKIFDAGCGDGVHSKVIDDLYNKDFIYFGLDISFSAVYLSSKKVVNNNNFVFINGDIANTPFINDFFDISFSYGVIAYTPDPFKSFQEICRVTKKGGLIGIWIYPKTSGLAGLIFSSIRYICKKSGKSITNLIANIIIPFLGFLPTKSHMSLKNASWKQCREIVMVNIAPKQLYFPKTEDIKEWFKKEKIEIIHEDLSDPIKLWGKKTS